MNQHQQPQKEKSPDTRVLALISKVAVTYSTTRKQRGARWENAYTSPVRIHGISVCTSLGFLFQI